MAGNTSVRLLRWQKAIKFKRQEKPNGENMKLFKLERLANKFCDSKVDEYPDIWWCYGDSTDRILFYTVKWSESENAKPIWKMDNDGNIEAI